jgi:hypothetical protein
VDKKKKKVNHLSLKECEQIIEKIGGMKECIYAQHILQRYNELVVKKAFKK